MKFLKLFLPVIIVILSACSVFQGKGDSGAAPQEALATAQITGFLPSTIKGTLYFNQVEEKGLVISGTIEGLLPDSTYAFHIMNGSCDSAETISGIFNPGNANKYGPPWLSPSQHPAGVLPNIQANGSGKADVDITVPCLDAVQGSQFSVLGHNVVLFSGPDDFKTGPSGEKIACGAIAADTSSQ